MKNKIKNNKTVVRSEKIAGKFTTIEHRIVNDKRLTTDSRILLISILSDADTFQISRTGLINRLGITEYILDKSLNNLCEFGYIRKSKVHAQYWHYTISEYGNLKKSDSNTNELEETTVPAEPSITEDEYHQMIKKIITDNHKFIEDVWIDRQILEIKSKEPNYYTALSSLKKLINKAKVSHYKTLKEYVDGGFAPKDLKPKILKEVRRLITNEHQILSEADVDKIRQTISHNRYKNKIKKHGFDYETQLADNSENSD